MARTNIKATISQAMPDGFYSAVVAGNGDPGGTAVTSAQTTVAANVATLVADGATPTQAHVTTLNTNWGTLNTALNGLTTADGGNVTVSVDLVVVTNSRQLKAALDQIFQYAVASGLVSR